MVWLRDDPSKPKLPLSTIVTIDFDGGINLADNPLALKQNELLEANNFQYAPSGAAIESRDGVELLALTSGNPPSGRGSTLLGEDGDSILFANSGGLYKTTTAGVVSKIGDLSYPMGVEPADVVPVVESWGDPVKGFLIASGGELQYYDGTTLANTGLEGSTNFVLKIGGRVVAAGQDGSRLTFSGLGDEMNWVTDSDEWTEMDALWIDIGYKSGGAITAFTKVNRDLVIFKDDGVIYRMTGDYPDWHVFEVGHSVFNVNAHTAKQFGNDVIFLDRHYGIHKLSSVSEFGDMRVEQFGRQVNSVLVNEMGSGARVWVLPSRAELWIKPDAGSKKLYVYNEVYQAWTTFTFPWEPTSAMSIGRKVYVSFKIVGNTGLVWEMKRDATSDSNEAISAKLTLRPIPSGGGKVLLDKSAIDVEGSGLAQYKINGKLAGSATLNNGAKRIFSYQRFFEDKHLLTVEFPSGKVALNQATVQLVEVM